MDRINTDLVITLVGDTDKSLIYTVDGNTKDLNNYVSYMKKVQAEVFVNQVGKLLYFFPKRFNRNPNGKKLAYFRTSKGWKCYPLFK